MKHLANIITICRILLSGLLLSITPFTWVFYLIYTMCGLSDMADGVIARKTGTQSHLGAALDSLADLIFLVVALVRLIPTIIHRLPGWVWYLVLFIAAVRLLAYVVGWVKYHRYAALHTIGNKVAGAALFCSPYLLLLLDVKVVSYTVCGLAGLSAVEELLIQILSKQFDPNIKSIFDK